MHLLPYVVAYAAVAVFLIAVVARIVMWARMPLHLRWELYPVAHEAKKAHYGGSYFEESEWWKKPREVSLWGELKVMLPEIFFLVALREHNKRLWYRSFPFHFGLYLVIGATAVMMAAGLLFVIAPGAVAGGFGKFLQVVTVVLGVGGLALGILGAVGLMHRRLTDPDLRDFTAPADLFNLGFFIVTFVLALLTFALVDQDFGRVQWFVYNLVTFKMGAIPGTGLGTILPLVSVVLLSLLLVYIPLTHMSHFIGKYFAYHAIRWNDAPNLRGSPEEKTIQALLSQKVSWAAPHIQGGGTKTWVDVATEEPKK
jgi:nitrate reductase gamma subunit